jgi:hypothetical protein
VWRWDATNVTAQRNVVGWEVSYADRDLLYGNDPHPHFLDIYAFDWDRKSFARVVHYRY